MKKFTSLSGPAAAIDKINIDTDQIIPKQYLTSITKNGLGKGLFHDFRYDMDDCELPTFILNKDPWKKAKILIAGENFGCGSSREHAPWSLNDFGIRCIIAPSFADIFFNNCGKNGILLISLSHKDINLLMSEAQNPKTCIITVDLFEQTIIRSNSSKISFDIDDSLKHRLLNGLDDIENTLMQADSIAAFEKQQQQTLPWLYNNKVR